MKRRKIGATIWLLVGLTWGVGTGASGFLMYRSRASGMAFDRTAATSNGEGVPTRTPGKSWHGFAINQTLK
jgi:hypothetical protein